MHDVVLFAIISKHLLLLVFLLLNGFLCVGFVIFLLLCQFIGLLLLLSLTFFTSGWSALSTRLYESGICA